MRSAKPIRTACRRSDPSARCRTTRRTAWCPTATRPWRSGRRPDLAGSATRTARACITPTWPRRSPATPRSRGSRRSPCPIRTTSWLRPRAMAARGAIRSSPRSRTPPCFPIRSRCGPITRPRARSSATCTCATRASAAVPVVRSPCSSSRPGMVATAGSRSRSRRRQITPSARTASADPVARSGPTRRVSCTCSTTSSHPTPRVPPLARSR